MQNGGQRCFPLGCYWVWCHQRRWCARRTAVVFLKWHLALLSLRPYALIVRSTSSRRWSCSSLLDPKTRLSSITTTVPSRLWSRVLISCWKIPGAEVIPNGRRLKQNLLMWVINVVSFFLMESARIHSRRENVRSKKPCHQPCNVIQCGQDVTLLLHLLVQPFQINTYSFFPPCCVLERAPLVHTNLWVWWLPL